MNWSDKAYARFLLFVGGLGGFLYGIDVGTIAVAQPYLKDLDVYSSSQLGFIVSGVLAGGIIASLLAGVLCNRFGRKKMIVVSAALFILSIPVLCLSRDSFAVMMTGRLVEGLGLGFLAVAMPMYLAECLPADLRGRGSGLFQLFLSISMVTAAGAGVLISFVFGAADAAGEGWNKAIAWRVDFLWTLVPATTLFICSLLLKESPVWLALRKGSGHAQNAKGDVASAPRPAGGSLLQRKYVLPFVLTLLVLTLNKTIGSNIVLSYAVDMFQRSGLTGAIGNLGDMALKGVNLAVTLLAVGLVDRKGRKWLLKAGTAGLTLGLLLIGGMFLAFEHGILEPSRLAGFITLGAFLAFQAFYSLGPALCVWLVLSELMPTRIRANGMAIALFSNQLVAWGLSAAFPAIGKAVGFGPLFLIFAVSGVLYFITVLFIPETKGKTLEELEHLFDRPE